MDYEPSTVPDYAMNDSGSGGWTDWISSAFKTAGSTYQAYNATAAAEAAAKANAKSSASLMKILPLALGGVVLVVVLVVFMGRRS